MSICEEIFAKRRYPDEIDQINSAYATNASYLKALKKLTSDIEKFQSPNKDKVAKYLRIYGTLSTVHPIFCKYLSTSPTHNKKRESVLSELPSEALTTYRKILSEAIKIEQEVKGSKVSLTTLVKNTEKCKKLELELKNIQISLGKISSNPEKEFRNIFKSV